MKTSQIFRRALCCGLLCLTGCGIYSPTEPGTAKYIYGGLGGAAVGAGTGALIGHAMAHGNVAQSTLVGAGAGVVGGLATAWAYGEISEALEVRHNNSIIEANADVINANQERINELRTDVLAETKSLQPNLNYHRRVFDGQTLANPYR